jgi:hypothetical protein
MITEGRRHTLTVRGDCAVHFTGYVSFAEPDLTSPDEDIIDIDDDINTSNGITIGNDNGNNAASVASVTSTSVPHDRFKCNPYHSITIKM